MNINEILKSDYELLCKDYKKATKKIEKLETRVKELEKGYCSYMEECNNDTNDCMQEEYHKLIKANVNLCNRIYKAIEILKGSDSNE